MTCVCLHAPRTPTIWSSRLGSEDAELTPDQKKERTPSVRVFIRV